MNILYAQRINSVGFVYIVIIDSYFVCSNYGVRKEVVQSREWTEVNERGGKKEGGGNKGVGGGKEEEGDHKGHGGKMDEGWWWPVLLQGWSEKVVAPSGWPCLIIYFILYMSVFFTTD
jgi:hypothetical protein